MSKPRKFEIGQLIVTDAVVNGFENDEEFRAFVYASFIRYCANDWGDLEREDAKINRRNVKHGGELGGRYVEKEKGWEIWILTTPTRDRTIVTFPDNIADKDGAEKRDGTGMDVGG
jgi:hypothetical protein